MNKTHALVWSETRQCWVVAHEAAAARGKPVSRRQRAGALAAALAATVLAQGALAQAVAPGALPTGGQVVAGQAAISQAGSAMTIQQATNQAILNWQSFNIGSQASVNFQQPSASAVALNRVLGGDPSAIYGALKANGQVFLLNPNGVLFGQGAKVDVGGLVASTLNIRNEDFLAGNLRFSRDGATGSVVNQGELTARYVALLAPEVRNEGVIATRMGSTALAAGEAVTLGISGNALIDVQVDQASINTLVANKHLVQAEGGSVLMSAQSAHTLLGRVVNTGAVAAQGISTEGGTVRLLASSSVEHSGSIKVDAGTNGQGGSAILLADLANPASQTTVAGSISARGGSEGGDGGFIETSGTRLKIEDAARIDTRAPQGQTGQWLLDPVNITIADSGGNVSVATLQTALAGSNVTVATTPASCSGVACPADASDAGDITVASSIAWSAATTLTLQADQDIHVNATIANSNTTAGGVKFQAARDVVFGANGLVKISNVEQLQNVGTAAAMSTMSIVGKYELTGNIDASATSGWNAGEGFLPIGGGPIPFQGSLDGKGYLINSLSMNATPYTEIGLFGAVGRNGSVRNLGLTNASIVSANTSAGGNVGALAAVNEGLIENSFVTGTVTGLGDPNFASFRGGDTIGGLVGTNSGTIRQSYSGAAVSSSTIVDGSSPLDGTIVGGLVGLNRGSIENSYASGAVKGDTAGGLLGFNDAFDNLIDPVMAGSVSNSYSSGAVTGITKAGGLVGDACTAFGAPYGYCASGTTVSNSYYDSSTSGQSDTGKGVAKTTAELKDPNFFTTVGWNGSTIWATGSDGYPMLRTIVYDGSGNSVTVYIRLTPGSSTYGDSPVLNWQYYTTADGSTVASVTGTPTGSISWADGSNNPLSLTASSAAGSYTVKYGGGLALSGYTFNAGTVASSNWTVNQAPLTITANNASKTYGQSYNLASHGYSYDSAQLKNGETLTGVSFASAGAAATAAAAAGGRVYAITGSNATGGNGFNAANYAVNVTPGQLTVNPATLAITINNASKTYGETYNLASHGYSYDSAQLKNGETLTGVSFASAGAAATAAAAAGGKVYAITGSNATGGNGFNAANYAVNVTPGQLTVNPVTLAITINNASKTYGETYNLASHTYSYDSAQLKNGNTLTGLTFASAGAVATASVAGGPYAITASDPTGGNGFSAGNYALSAPPGQLTVDKANLTITASDLSKQAGQALTFTGTEFRQTGLQNTAAGHRLTTATLSSDGAAASATLAGSPYAIRISNVQGSGGFDANNYNVIDYVDGKLTLTAITTRDVVAALFNAYASQNVTWDTKEVSRSGATHLADFIDAHLVSVTVSSHNGLGYENALDDTARWIEGGETASFGDRNLALDRTKLFWAVAQFTTKYCTTCQDLNKLTMNWFMQGMK